jgi:hypothetical protein
MSSNSTNNPNPANASDNQESHPLDWREQRWEWRRQRREARRRDPWHGLFLGLLLAMIGGIFLAVQMGGVPVDSVWKYILVGIGSIFIVDGLVRYRNPAFPHFVYVRLIAGAALLTLGILFIFDYSNWWSIILIAAGCAILFRLFLRKI